MQHERYSLSDKELKNVIYNALYLLSTQGVAYVAPVLVLGHLISTLGVDGFGKYAFYLALMAYFQVVIDYGFAFSSSREISQNREDKNQISKIYWTTNYIKLIICIILFPIIYFTAYLIQKENFLGVNLLATFLWAFGNSMYPIWFYQGIEKLKTVAVINIISRVTSCGLVLYFVTSKVDVSLAIFMQGIPVIIGSVIAHLNIYKRKFISVVNPNIDDFKKSIFTGWDFFVATLGSTILTNSAVFILGIYYSAGIVGFYASVERLIKAVVSLFAPITQSLYPYNCRKFSESFNSGCKSAKRTGKPLALLSITVSFILIASWSFISTWLKIPSDSFVLVCVLIPWLIMGVINNILGIQILSAAGYANKYSKAFLFSTIFTLCSILILSKLYAVVGAGLAVSIGELLLGIVLVIQINKIKSNH